MKAKLVNESMGFERTKNPLDNLNIGKKAKIEKWLSDHNFNFDKLKVNDKLEVELDNANGIISIESYLKRKNIILPDYIKFVGPNPS